MNPNFKRLLSLGLALVLCISASVSAMAYGQPSNNTSIRIKLDSDGTYIQEDRTLFGANDLDSLFITKCPENSLYSSEDARYFSRVDENRFVETGKVSIDISNQEEIQAVAAKFLLNEVVVARLTELNELYNDPGSEIEITSVEVYTPNAVATKASSKTYTGYKGEKYIDTIVHTESNTKTPAELFKSKTDAMNAHIKQSTTDVLNFIFAYGLDFKTYGAYSLFSLGMSLIPSSAETGAISSHTARLYSKYDEKITQIYVGSEAIVGATTTTGTYYFNDYMHTGYGIADDSTITEKYEFTTPNYNSADALAYSQWNFGGLYERVASVEHYNVSFNIV